MAAPRFTRFDTSAALRISARPLESVESGAVARSGAREADMETVKNDEEARTRAILLARGRRAKFIFVI
jgi:hypothetical protein